MTDGATGGPPASVEAQDPLPESNWFWRRVYVGILTAVLCAAVYYFAGHLAASTSSDQTEAFLSLTKWTLLLLWFVATYYLVAPSAEQVTRMWQTANVLKAGVTMSKTNIAVSPDGSAAGTTTTASTPGDTGPPPASVLAHYSGSGLPGEAEAYEGPPLSDVPPVHPDLPEDAPWKP